MNMNKYLDVNPEVAAAIAEGKPVVALESTIISHGMPYPQNVKTALNVERIIRENGETLIPSGNDFFRPGDDVIIVTTNTDLTDLRDIVAK